MIIVIFITTIIFIILLTGRYVISLCMGTLDAVALGIPDALALGTLDATAGGGLKILLVQGDFYRAPNIHTCMHTYIHKPQLPTLEHVDCLP